MNSTASIKGVVPPVTRSGITAGSKPSPQAIIATIKINVPRRPLWQAETVQECLEISREKLMALIESGELAWAFNIGIGQTRQEIRVLGHCVVEKQSGPIPGLGRTRSLNLPEVLNLVLPARPQLRATEVQRIFCCQHHQVHKLIRLGEFAKVQEQLPKCGPNGSPHVTRASVAKFLEKRRMA